jgi:predicted  nucleic acid-binding Zn-ribbon protein
MRKLKTKIVRKPVPTKASLIEHIQKMKAELEGAKQIIEAMQTEIKQLTQMHRTHLQIIDNLSNKLRND